MQNDRLKTLIQSISQLSHKFTMPSAGVIVPPANRFDQMRCWLSDPILRDEAAQWAKRHDVEIVYSEYGVPIDLIKNTESDD
jgi:hypothetical protein